jgi:hypothetical protein
MLYSDVLLILDCHRKVANPGEGKEEKQTFLCLDSWARFGIVWAGYNTPPLLAGQFSNILISTLEGLAHSERLADLKFVFRKIMGTLEEEQSDMNPDAMGNDGYHSIVLSPVLE